MNRQVSNWLRHRRGFAGIVAAGVAVAALLSGGTGVAQESQFEAHKAIQAKPDFLAYCASCHGDEGRGDGPFTKMFGVHPIDLRLLSLNNDGEFPYQYVRTIIDGREDVRTHGTRTMPVWFNELWSSMDTAGTRQTLERIDNLTEYIASIQLRAKD